jgi:hypothetical protein
VRYLPAISCGTWEAYKYSSEALVRGSLIALA